jgi:hypothetical protein
MYKTMTTFSLREGTDPAKFWKYHTEVYAVEFINVAGPGLKKYVINRVINMLDGNPGFVGLIEMWWENKEILKNNNPDKLLLEKWLAHGAIPVYVSYVEEKEILKPVGPKTDSIFKTLGAYRLQSGTDGDEFWKFHTEVHAIDVKNSAGPLLWQYCVSRHLDSLLGHPSFFAVIEMWWRDKKAPGEFATKIAKNYITASGKTLEYDWMSHNTIDVFRVVSEELEIPIKS